MMRIRTLPILLCLVSVTAAAQQMIFTRNYHLGFDQPEAWALKYFASSTLLSGLQPAEEAETRGVGSITLGIETGWLPALDAGQQLVGFDGKVPEDLNKAPVFIRPMIKVKLPADFSVIVAAPPPLHVFGVSPRLLALGLEHPILNRGPWMIGWRGYGQFGYIKGAFTCPDGISEFALGSSQNPTRCLGPSADKAYLNYVGSEFQVAYRLKRMPRLVPHLAVGGNFIDGAIQVHAPIPQGIDETKEWTHGGTFSTTFGASYLLTKQVAFTVDAFYSPLEVQRNPTARDTNDGLFNVRALLSYTFR